MERPSGLRERRVDVVKGRKRRVRKLGIVEAMMRRRMERMKVVRGFSLGDEVECLDDSECN